MIRGPIFDAAVAIRGPKRTNRNASKISATAKMGLFIPNSTIVSKCGLQQKLVCVLHTKAACGGVTFRLPSILFAARGEGGRKQNGRQAAVVLNGISIVLNVRLTVLNYGPRW